MKYEELQTKYFKNTTRNTSISISFLFLKFSLPFHAHIWTLYCFLSRPSSASFLLILFAAYERTINIVISMSYLKCLIVLNLSIETSEKWVKFPFDFHSRFICFAHTFPHIYLIFFLFSQI